MQFNGQPLTAYGTFTKVNEISQGRSAKYTFTTGGWKRILNIIRGSTGMVDLGLVCNYPFRSTQILAFDLSGYVKYPAQKDGTKGDTTASKPVLIKRYENSFGIAGTQNNPQAKITKVRIGYPAKGTSFPERPQDGYEYNPINCYVDIYVDIDENKIIEGRALPDFNMNYAGFANSHNCEAIEKETDALDTGIYGETLTYYEIDVAGMNGYVARESINRDGAYPHYGLAFTGGGKGPDLRIVPATNEQIDAASPTVYNPITPGNLDYAVRSVGDKHYALVSEFSKYFPLASKYGLYLNNGYLSVTPASTTQIDKRESQYSVITPYNLKYAVDSVLGEHGLLEGGNSIHAVTGQEIQELAFSQSLVVGDLYIVTETHPDSPYSEQIVKGSIWEATEVFLYSFKGNLVDTSALVQDVIAALPVYDGGVV